MSRIAVALALAGLTILPAAAAAKPANISVVGTQTSLKQKGNTASFTETLRSGKKTIGHDAITCTFVTGSIFTCRGTFTFKRGTVRVSGRINQANKSNQIRIVGGTGSYKGAKGTLKLHDTSPTTTAEKLLFS